jgi:periplasmic divalent cation tolerance protein
LENRFVIVFITVDSQEEAQKITDILLTERKAACVNILPGVESHYWWQGKKETAQEILLIVKTQEKLLDELVTLVKMHHPYSIPEIVAIPIIGGNIDYLKWLERETD